MKKQKSSITRLVYTQSRAGFPSWLGVPITSLSTQNRLYSLNTSMSDKTDLGFPLLIGGLAVSSALLLRVFTRNQQYVFLPLLVSFSECIRVYRFQFRCSHTVLCIHYNKASQH